MPRKGNLPALRKAIQLNPKMTRRAKGKALSTVDRKMARARHSRRSKSGPQNGGQGIEGFKEASLAGAKLVSTPIHQAVEGYHFVNGVRKVYRAVEKWLNENS